MGLLWLRIRTSLRYIPPPAYDQIVKDLRPIYTAIDSDHSHHALLAESSARVLMAPGAAAWQRHGDWSLFGAPLANQLRRAVRPS